jgi:hypothetical protein
MRRVLQVHAPPTTHVRQQVVLLVPCSMPAPGTWVSSIRMAQINVRTLRRS